MALEQYLLSKLRGYSQDFIENVRNENMPEAELCLARAIQFGHGLLEEISKKGVTPGIELREDVIELMINSKKLGFKLWRPDTYFTKAFPQESLDQRWGYLEQARDSFNQKLPDFYKSHNNTFPAEELVQFQMSFYKQAYETGKFPKAFENPQNFQMWFENERQSLMDHRGLVWCAAMENMERGQNKTK